MTTNDSERASDSPLSIPYKIHQTQRIFLKMKLNECPLPILALFLFLILIMPTACSQLTLQLMRMSEPYRVHIQGFSASFLQLFCLMIVQLTLLLAYLLLPMHMKNYFFLPLVLLPYSGSVCVLAFLILSLCVSGNLSYSIHSI